jgi:hypothetical protein
VADPQTLKSAIRIRGSGFWRTSLGMHDKRCDICTPAGSSATPAPVNLQTSGPRDMCVDVRYADVARLKLFVLLYFGTLFGVAGNGPEEARESGLGATTRTFLPSSLRGAAGT